MSRQNIKTMASLDEIIANEGLQLITSHIFQFLDLHSLNQCRVVSPKWKIAVEADDQYWNLCVPVIVEKLKELHKHQEEVKQITHLEDDWVPLCNQDIFKSADKPEHLSFRDFLRFLQRFLTGLTDRNYATPLQYAAQCNNVPIVKMGLANSITFDIPKSLNALHIACKEGHEETVKCIFEVCYGVNQPVDLNRRDGTHEHLSPFEYVCQGSNLNLLNLFLDSAVSKGIDLCGSALVKASPDCFKVLIERAPELTFDQESKNKLLHTYYSKEDFQDLLDIHETVNFDFNAVDDCGRTPLLWTCMNKHPDMFEMLLKFSKSHGITLDLKAQTESSKQTVLHFACWRQDPAMLSTLFKYCADKLDFEVFNAQGLTPLHYAVCNLETFKLLKEQFEDKGFFEIDFTMKDRSGRSLLQSVFHAEHPSAVKYFLSVCKAMGLMDFYLEHTDGKGCTVWHEAVRNKDYLQLLIDYCQENRHDIELNAIDHYDRTPLHYACLRPFSQETAESVKLLLEYAQDNFIAVNARDEDGRTPVYFACMTEARLQLKYNSNFWSPFQYLLENSTEYGISLNIRDKNGLTLLHWLSSNAERYAQLKLLLEYATDTCLDLNPLDEDGNHPLHLACLHGNSHIVKLLLESSSDLRICLNPTDATGKTPLHIACIENKPKVVETVLRYSKQNGGINLNLKDEEGFTAFDRAYASHHWNVVDHFKQYAKRKWVH